MINIHFSKLSQLDSWSYVSHLILSFLPLSQNYTDLSTSRLLRLLLFNFNQVRNLFLLYKCLYKIICGYYWIIAKICPATSYTLWFKNSHVSVCLIPLCAQWKRSHQFISFPAHQLTGHITVHELPLIVSSSFTHQKQDLSLYKLSSFHSVDSLLPQNSTNFCCPSTSLTIEELNEMQHCSQVPSSGDTHLLLWHEVWCCQTRDPTLQCAHWEHTRTLRLLTGAVPSCSHSKSGTALRHPIQKLPTYCWFLTPEVLFRVVITQMFIIITYLAHLLLICIYASSQIDN